MNKYPKIRLVDDPAKDAQLGVDFTRMHFRKSKDYLRKFLPDDLLGVLKKGMPAKERDRRIRAFTRRRHREDHSKIAGNLRLIRKDWRRVEGKYFRLVDKIFKKYPWPKGKYVGYVTVFWSYPRNINEKTFYFPYKHRKPHMANRIIAHECLHFIFFEYVKEKFGIDWRKEKWYGHLWKVSEAFNAMIEDWPPYKRIFIYSNNPYMEIEDMVKKMSRQWNRQQDIDKLLAKWLKRK